MASQQILDEIRRRLSIVTLVGERLPLKKSGRNFKGLCPFHPEKTPSFMVHEEKQIFHCFGCHTGGDIFTFLMKLDGLTFPEALEELAKKAQVKLPRFQGETTADADLARRKEWAARLNKIAQQYFTGNLNDPQGGKLCRDYLDERGIAPETAKELGLGCAKKGWNFLLQELQKAKSPLGLAQELGLIKKREKGEGYFDFFRNRLIFPILDVKGQITGFSGRLIEKEEGAKYLNSQDSFLYHKSSALFGLYWAREAIRASDEVFLVEGNIDFVSLWQAGVKNVAAPCGSALTPEHLQILSRTTKNMVLAFDGDDAGLKGAFRTLPLFLEQNLTPLVLALPKGEDPDTFIRKEGIEGWKKLRATSQTLFEYYLNWVVKISGEGTKATLKAWELLGPLIKMVKNPLEKELYLKKASERLKIDEKELKNIVKSQKEGNRVSQPARQAGVGEYPLEERLLLAALVMKADLLKRGNEVLELFTHPTLKEISKQLFLGSADENGCHPFSLLEEKGAQLASWVREMALAEEKDIAWEKVFEDCLLKLGRKNLKGMMNALNEKIALAEKEGNASLLSQLLAEKARMMEAKKGSRHERTI